jgi:hypothetical protein
MKQRRKPGGPVRHRPLTAAQRAKRSKQKPQATEPKPALILSIPKGMNLSRDELDEIADVLGEQDAAL